MKNSPLLRWLVLASTVLMIALNSIPANVFDGVNNATMSRKYQTLITPAGYAFAIWGIIFLGVLIYAIYQVLPAQRSNRRFDAAAPWIIANMIFNGFWTIIFGQEWIAFATIVIIADMLTLYKIAEALGINRVRVSATETWLARVPFSIYFGWLTVATTVCVALFLKANGFNAFGLSEQTWAVIILGVAWLIGAVVFNRFQNIAYILVFTWAYYAISVQAKAIALVPQVAIVGAVGAVVLAVIGLINQRRARLGVV
jgi:hypothetical protein